MKGIILGVSVFLFAFCANAVDSTFVGSTAGVNMSLPIGTEGSACPGTGATAFTSTGLLLSCQSGSWKNQGLIGASSLTVNGYTSFSNGLKIQWGSVTGSCFGFNVVYPTAFDSQVFSTTVSTSSSTANYDAQATNLSLTGFRVSNPGCTTGASFNYKWQATGL